MPKFVKNIILVLIFSFGLGSFVQAQSVVVDSDEVRIVTDDQTEAGLVQGLKFTDFGSIVYKSEASERKVEYLECYVGASQNTPANEIVRTVLCEMKNSTGVLRNIISQRSAVSGHSAAAVIFTIGRMYGDILRDRRQLEEQIK